MKWVAQQDEKVMRKRWCCLSEDRSQVLPIGRIQARLLDQEGCCLVILALSLVKQ